MNDDSMRRKIRARLTRAGFEVTEQNGELLAKGKQFTIRCYWDECHQQWRTVPYDHTVQATVREVVTA